MARLDGIAHRSHLGGLAHSLTISATVAVPGDEPFSIELTRQAVPFYARFRAVVVGESPSTSIAGRSLPRMRIATTL